MMRRRDEGSMKLDADAIAAGLVAGAVLLAEHYLLQRGERSLKPPITYILGVSTLGAAVTWWAQRKDAPEAADAFWLISGIGGAATVAAYLWDTMQEE
jgi:hypothetical protein